MRTLSLIRILATLLLAGAMAAHAADKPKRVKYVPPDGFAGYKWGDLRSKFTDLPEQPVGVGAAWMSQQPKDREFYCIQSTGPQGAAAGCDIQSMLLQARGRFVGGGTYVLSEYSVDDQGVRFGDADPVMLYPVVYLFCAKWGVGVSRRTTTPDKFDDMNKFCGMRMQFDTETSAQLKALPSDYVTTYDRVLSKLMKKFGKPKSWSMDGRVIIERLDGNDPDDRPDRKLAVWRWCPALLGALRPDCTASVTLSLDPVTGKATLLYSTPVLWEYAFARQNFGFKGDRLFKMLHATN